MSESAELSSKTDETGQAQSPYAGTQSIRFKIVAKGFIDHVGYAIGGQNLPAVLMSEERFTLAQSQLNFAIDRDYPIVMGKIVDRNLRAMSKMKLDDIIVSDPFKIH